jgi:hypothetical protein
VNNSDAFGIHTLKDERSLGGDFRLCMLKWLISGKFVMRLYSLMRCKVLGIIFEKSNLLVINSGDCNGNFYQFKSTSFYFVHIRNAFCSY